MDRPSGLGCAELFYFFTDGSAFLCVFSRLVHGNGIPVGIPWKCPMGWDGTARIAFPMGPMGQ